MKVIICKKIMIKVFARARSTFPNPQQEINAENKAASNTRKMSFIETRSLVFAVDNTSLLLARKI